MVQTALQIYITWSQRVTYILHMLFVYYFLTHLKSGAVILHYVYCKHRDMLKHGSKTHTYLAVTSITMA